MDSCDLLIQSECGPENLSVEAHTLQGGESTSHVRKSQRGSYVRDENKDTGWRF